ncbi:helix-turn-helix domain-containing protein [Streptomyces laurentii]|uniref:MmyB family transcriptional regulator n=1 Tax=Streptomyces laurentii TaxID=39478 RepID=UPI00368C1250
MNLTELGAFVRSRRDRVQPSEVGLVAGPRRRVPGLRRDEVAVLAGASTDYYIEIERGGAQPSEQMLAALARALRLTRDERDHLYRLAGRPLPPSGGSSAHVHPAMFDLLDRLAAMPAFVCTDLHVMLVQNRLADALFGPIVPTTGPGASFIHQWFTGDPRARALYPEDDHEHHSRTFVADLRAAVGRRGRGDQGAERLIGELERRSEEFARLWAEREVAVRRADRKRVRHPSLGILHLNCLNLLSEDGRQRLLWFTPVSGTDTGEKLELLAVLGTQDLRAEV